MSRDILVVEDEIKIAEILKDYLVSAGYRVSCLDQRRFGSAPCETKPPRLDSSGHHDSRNEWIGRLSRDQAIFECSYNNDHCQGRRN